MRAPLSWYGIFCSTGYTKITWIPHSIWLIGILIKCIFYIKDCISLRKILNQSTYSPSDAALDKIVRDLVESLHLTHIPSIRYCSLTSTPVTVKEHNFIILLPQRDYSSNELFAILLHEMIHIKHNDLRKFQWGRILNIIFWFYPVAYLFRRDIELLCETVCDRTVLSLLKGDLSHHDYFALILSHLQSKQMIPSCIGLNNKIQLKYRMSTSRSASFTHRKQSILFSILAGVLLFASSSLIAQASVEPIDQLNYDWFNATTEAIEIPWYPPVYTFYTDDEDPSYMDSVFLKELDMDKLIDTRIDGGIETYSYTLAPGARADDVYLYLTPDSSFCTAGVCNVTPNIHFRVGLTDGHQKTYISLHENGYGTHFSVPSSGIYRIFMENVSSTSITILGSYAFDPSQNIDSNQ